MQADALILPNLATIRADRRTQIEWLGKIDTAVQELLPHIEDKHLLDQLDAACVKLRIELRRANPRNRHISVGWLNIIVFLLLALNTESTEYMEEVRKDELIMLFTNFVEQL